MLTHTSIGVDAFSGCESLKEITMPKSITSIGDSAFQYCGNLMNITIPIGVTSIGDSVFSDCGSLTNVIIPGGVTSIGDDAFCYCRSLTNITIPDGVKSIGNSAFYDCRALESINIPNSIKSIGDHTFHDCESLTIIGDYVFFGCADLTYIALPKTLTEINKYAFDGCSSLFVIFFGGSKEEWKEIYIASGNDALSTANVVYNAEKKTYKFETNCDSALADVTDYAVMSSPKVANSAKTLLGWYDNESLAGNPISFPYYGNATTLYAAWTDKTGLSFEDAFSASANHEYSVTVGENGQNVYFEFVPKLSGEYRFYSKGNCDTYGCLYDSDKSRLASDDDSGENSNFKITCNLNAGETYYIAVKNYNGTGTFVLVTETDCAEGTKTVCVTGNNGEKIFVSVPNYLPEDAKIILACYKDNALSETQIAANKNETLYFTVKKDFNRAKVMVWNSLTSLKPICKAEIVFE